MIAVKRELAQDKRMKRTATAPHSFSERLKEYVELSLADKNNAETMLALEWRKGIIDAELKYGEMLDKIHTVPMQDVFSTKSEKLYQNFVDTVKIGKNGVANMKEVDQVFVDNFGKFFKNGDRLVLDGKRKYKGVGFNIGERITEVRSMAKEAASLSNVKLGDVYVGHLEGKGNDPTRGFALTATTVQGKNIFNFMGVGFLHDARTLAFHETGHLIEDTTKLAKTSVDYISSRTLTEEGTELVDGIESPVTDFLHQYTGKVYGARGEETATEVVSMGVEGLSRFQRIHRLVLDDIDHLRYTLFALDKTAGI